MKLGVYLTSGILFILNASAFASLGGDVASVQKDAERLKSTRTVTQRTKYSMHEMSKHRVLIHEFVGTGGTVFALAWRGPQYPDLSTLTGAYLKDFQSAIAKARMTHRHGGAMLVEYGNIHLEMGGHMMAVYGHAWLKDQIPNGMDLHEIQ